jgi:hypothetical protein
LMKDQVLLGADPDDFLITQMKLEEVKLQINKTLGRTILH